MQGGSYTGLELHGINEVMEGSMEIDDLNEISSLELPPPTKEMIDDLNS